MQPQFAAALLYMSECEGCVWDASKKTIAGLGRLDFFVLFFCFPAQCGGGGVEIGRFGAVRAAAKFSCGI